MTDSARLQFLQDHACSFFPVFDKTIWVVQLGDCNPIAMLDGNGPTLAEAIDDCRAKNFDAERNRIRHKLMVRS